MKRKKKGIALILGLIMVLTLLGGCSDDGKEKKIQQDTSQEAEKESSKKGSEIGRAHV